MAKQTVLGVTAGELLCLALTLHLQHEVEPGLNKAVQWLHTANTQKANKG